MFCVASLVPSPPVLVPELGGAAGTAADTEVAALRTAVLRAGRELAGQATRWIVVGADEVTRVIGSDAVGTFRGYGADLRVGLTGGSHFDDENADPALPLPALIAGWLREQVAPAETRAGDALRAAGPSHSATESRQDAATPVVAEARLVAADLSSEECVAFGRALRAELEAAPESYGVLAVGDGAATLSTKSPRYFDERAEKVQAEIDRALAAGDRDALAALDQRLCAELAVAGRPVFQVLAGLFAENPEVETLYAAAPFGVAYQVSVWRPGGSA
ncbi:hypothetical protein ACIP5Y_01950 [Nocardia sp. NPDC088792]|uniref:hypothetical protein n=1 Tax=Nocardia sp. NPDC088792 TaxID=3364332 RepID=UPI00382F5CAE